VWLRLERTVHRPGRRCQRYRKGCAGGGL